MSDLPDPTSRRVLPLLALGAAAAVLTLSPGAADAEEEDKSTSGDPLAVDLPSLVLPVAEDGRLINYLFAQVRVGFADSRSADQIRTHQFFARDAIIRAAARAPVAPGTTRGTYGAGAVRQMIAQAVAGCMRGIRVARVEIRDAQFLR